MPAPLQILRVALDSVEFCDLRGVTQIRLSREDWSVEYVADDLNKEIVEEIINEILSDYRSVERIRTFAKSIYK